MYSNGHTSERWTAYTEPSVNIGSATFAYELAPLEELVDILRLSLLPVPPDSDFRQRLKAELTEQIKPQPVKISRTRTVRFVALVGSFSLLGWLFSYLFSKSPR